MFISNYNKLINNTYVKYLYILITFSYIVLFVRFHTLSLIKGVESARLETNRLISILDTNRNVERKKGSRDVR